MAMIEQPTTGYRFGDDFFGHNVDHLSRSLADVAHRDDIHMLEIGSFQGRSACWLLDNILTSVSSTLTCIDPDFPPVFESNIEKTGASERVIRYGTSSQEALPRLEQDSYHLVFIDGDHRARSVFQDAALAWPLLKVRGILLFDDYGWHRIAADSPSHPSRAIDRFLFLMRDDIQVLHKKYSVMLRKRSNSVEVDFQKVLQEFPDERPELLPRKKQD